MHITELKLKSTPLGIRKIDIGLEGGYFLFEDEPNIDPMKLVQLIQKQPQKYKLEGQHKLRLMWAMGNFEEKILFLALNSDLSHFSTMRDILLKTRKSDV